MSRASIEVRGVRKAYPGAAPGQYALDDVSVAIAGNEFFTLLGPSGCGKTTLLRLIAGFEFPTAGSILLDGEDLARLPPFRRPVNTVFQSYALFPHLTVAQNIGFGLEMLGRPKTEIAARVAEMLALVRMEELAGRRTDQISGGQAQRVALARALAPQPKVLLLDEPLSALDYKLRKEMQIELKRMQHETGITFIFVTHDQEEALSMSDRIAVMSKGRILQVGNPREIYDQPADRFVANFIGEANFLGGTVERVEGRLATVRLAGGARLLAGVPAGAAPTGEVTVVIRPEQADLAPAAGAVLGGRVETIVYSGSATDIHLRLAGGAAFVIRSQSRRGGETPEVGAEVGIAVAPEAAQVLAH